MQRPILYSFRRCPYAMRARLAIMVSGIECELREVLLKDKPATLLTASPKGSVPVLVSADQVIDESIDIAVWALSQNDPDNWLGYPIDHPLIVKADTQFKPQLDRYKYADRYPENTEQEYFEQAAWYLLELEEALLENSNKHASPYLLSRSTSVLDVMVFPFIRQFASVNRARFDALPLPKLHRWLNAWLESDLFKSIMHKYPLWSAQEPSNIDNQQTTIIFGGTSLEGHGL